MAKGFAGELLHFVSVRFRITGSGVLQVYLRSMDNVRNSQLPSITMQATTNREPVVIANFREQRVQLELRTVNIDETFNIKRIILFAKPTATGYPQ